MSASTAHRDEVVEAAIGALNEFAAMLLKSGISKQQHRSILAIAWETARSGDALLGLEEHAAAALTTEETALCEIGSICIAGAIEAAVAGVPHFQTKSRSPGVRPWEWIRWRVDACARAASATGLDPNKCEALRNIGAALLEPYRLEFERVEKQHVEALRLHQQQQQLAEEAARKAEQHAAEMQQKLQRVEELKKLDNQDPELRAAADLELEELQHQLDSGLSPTSLSVAERTSSTAPMEPASVATPTSGTAGGQPSAGAGPCGAGANKAASSSQRSVGEGEEEPRPGTGAFQESGTASSSDGARVQNHPEEAHPSQTTPTREEVPEAMVEEVGDGQGGSQADELQSSTTARPAAEKGAVKARQEAKVPESMVEEVGDGQGGSQADELQSSTTARPAAEKGAVKARQEAKVPEAMVEEVGDGQGGSQADELQSSTTARPAAEKGAAKAAEKGMLKDPAEAKAAEKGMVKATEEAKAVVEEAGHGQGGSEAAAEQGHKSFWVEPSGSSGPDASWMGPLSAREVLKLAEAQTLGPEGLVWGLETDAVGPPSDARGAQPLWQCLPDLGNQLRRASEIQLRQQLDQRFKKAPRQEDATDILPGKG